MKSKLKPQRPILLVDDESNFLESLEMTLFSHGFNNISKCHDSTKVTTLLKNHGFSIIILDLFMPDLPGEELILYIRDKKICTPIIVLTGNNDSKKAVNCIKLGADEYLEKPIDENELVNIINNILKSDEYENDLNHISYKQKNAFSCIISNNQEIKQIFSYINSIAENDFPILITGETGTGKGLLVKAIHNLSGKKGKFIELNIAGMDSALVSDTLFGHVQGSYTGAKFNRKGLIEQASGGTFFLDEIGDLNIDIQLKLLRLLQDKKYYPVGSDFEKTTDTRFIFATNQNIIQLMLENKIRKDLYFRLQTHHIHLPPLRERKGDIKLLISYFVEKASALLKIPKPLLPNRLMDLLYSYNYPGNIRELESIIYDIVNRTKKGSIPFKEIEKRINLNQNPDRKKISNVSHSNPDIKENYFSDFEVLPTLSDVGIILIKEALSRSNNNQTMAAKMLGITRKALNNRIIRARKKGYFIEKGT